MGWTQQELAERVAISRVALSNLESGRSVPSERTVVLLSGVFGVEPHELVEGTDYPPQKSDRLPPVAARYTEVDLELSLLDRDLDWLSRREAASSAPEVLLEWRERLSKLRRRTFDRHLVGDIDAAHARVVRLLDRSMTR